jgi:hypothetical protein
MTGHINPPKKAPFPFSMIEAMMPRFPLFVLMGWAMVGLALIIGAFWLAPARATFFTDAKAVREAVAAGSAFVDANLRSHIIETWVPHFKFLGLGIGLAAITMALGVIAKQLQRMGQVIASHIRADLRPTLPTPPRRVRVFQLGTMMGLMILMITALIAALIATSVVPAYWSHSIANELNPASPGSALLSQLGTLRSYSFWLNPIRLVGMGFLFTAITIALTVIIGVLRTQGKLLMRFYQEASSIQ